MAKLGHHPGDHFLSAFLPAVQQHLASPATRRGGGGTKPSLPPSLPRSSESGNNLPQNLSLILVALAVLQYIPSSSFWEAFTQALLSLPSPPFPLFLLLQARQRTSPPSLPPFSSLTYPLACGHWLRWNSHPPSLPLSFPPSLNGSRPCW